MMSNFVVFILSHGRAEKVITLDSLKKSGYTGDYFIVCDNEDKTVEKYKERFGKEKVVVFDKLEMSKKFDTADLSDERRTIVYARNACFDIAEQLGYEYFLELDDDYTGFYYRKQEGDSLRSIQVKDFDRLCSVFIDFLENTPVDTIAFAQGGDFIGGARGGVWKKGFKRKAMNSFFFKTNSDIRFVGRINEDVNTYTWLGSQGRLFLTQTKVSLTQLQTQSNAGGMTDVYLDGGTYLKSFYSVLFMPSAVDVRLMGTAHKRLHHHVNWDRCVPLIVDESLKKGG